MTNPIKSVISPKTPHGSGWVDLGPTLITATTGFESNAFGMTDAEEDNHVPGGFVRNYWLSVAENLIGHECQCKTTEPAIKEDKGDFVWRGVNS